MTITIPCILIHYIIIWKKDIDVNRMPKEEEEEEENWMFIDFEY